MEDIIKKFTTIDCLGNNLMTPLVVSRQHKVLYLHIAKTGGSSIVQLLKNNGMDDIVLSNKRGIYEEKVDYFKDVVAHWDEYYKFTFVRNKFDLLISLYNYDRQLNGKYSLPNDITFEQFLKEQVGVREGLYTELIDQYYLTHTNDKCMFNFIGQFDTYSDDLNKVCSQLGIVNTQERTNVGNYDRSKKREYYTEELKQLVKEKFPKEIEKFDWWY
tara:strand:- start:26490 stop:27137 length:648 start_codon:yes stop_codon:yes gene_type:complete